MSKQWLVNFKLKEIAASKYYQSASVEASDLGLAVRRAWAIVKKREGVKGKRLRNVDISVEELKESDE